MKQAAAIVAVAAATALAVALRLWALRAHSPWQATKVIRAFLVFGLVAGLIATVLLIIALAWP